MLCNLLDCFLTSENVPPDCPKEWYELYFAYACIWAFGSTMFKDQLIDWRKEFSRWWLNEFKTIKFPSNDLIFNYHIDNNTKKLLPWNETVGKFELDMDIPLQVNNLKISCPLNQSQHYYKIFSLHSFNSLL